MARTGRKQPVDFEPDVAFARHNGAADPTTSEPMRPIRQEILRFSSHILPEPERVSASREIFGRTILRHDVEPLPDHPFGFEAMLYVVAELGFAAGTVSPILATRSAAHADSDDVVLTINLSGGRVVRQRGREATIGAGEAVLTSGADPIAVAIHSASRAIALRVPLDMLRPSAADLDACLVRTIPSGTEALRLLVSYAGVVEDTNALAMPELRGLLVAHFHDLVSMSIGATRDAAEVARGRGVRAARLRAIKSYILENLSRGDLSIDAVATRHGISARYVRMLFDGEGATFSDFVLGNRLARAHRMLRDPRYIGHTISAMAFECGFGDLSYFNRAFRRRYGATPTDVREAVRSDDCGA
jgi:AraC-like DNA-binding protein